MRQKTLTETIQQARRALDGGRVIDAQALMRNAEYLAVELEDTGAARNDAIQRAFERICPMPELPALLQRQAD